MHNPLRVVAKEIGLVKTVTVCCKLPMGIILRDFERKQVREQGPAGCTEVTRNLEIPGSRCVSKT
jgi:hypothetical protein